MKVVCQKCGAAYAINEAAIPAKGARAQCPRCKALQAVQRPDAEALASAPPSNAAPSGPAPAPSPPPPPLPSRRAPAADDPFANLNLGAPAPPPSAPQPPPPAEAPANPFAGLDLEDLLPAPMLQLRRLRRLPPGRMALRLSTAPTPIRSPTWTWPTTPAGARRSCLVELPTLSPSSADRQRLPPLREHRRPRLWVGAAAAAKTSSIPSTRRWEPVRAVAQRSSQLPHWVVAPRTSPTPALGSTMAGLWRSSGPPPRREHPRQGRPLPPRRRSRSQRR